MKNRIFLVHLRRMLTRPALYLTMVLHALLIALPLLTKSALTLTALDGLQTYVHGLFGVYYVGLLVLPAVPYAICCSDDKNTRMLYFWCIRSGVRQYGAAYYLCALLSGFLMTFGSILLYFWIAAGLGYSVYHQPTGTPPYKWLYDALVHGEDYRLLVLWLAVDFALGAMAVAGVAAAAASVFKNKITVYTVPMIAALLMIYLVDFRNDVSLMSLACARHLGDSFGPHVLNKLLVVLLYTSVCGVITVKCIERGMRRG